MKDMVTKIETDCPFEFNYDPARFKVGDIVSYRVPDAFEDMPFVGEILSVASDHIVLRHYGEEDGKKMRATRESRPVVTEQDALGC